MRPTVLVLVLVNVLVLAFGLRGGFARVHAPWQHAGQADAPLTVPATAAPTLTLLHEQPTTSPPARAQQGPPAVLDGAVPPAAAGASGPAPQGPARSPPPAARERPTPPSAPTPAPPPADLRPPETAPALSSPPLATPAPIPVAPPDASSNTAPDACVVAGPYAAQQDADRLRLERAAQDLGASLLGRETRGSGRVRQWVLLEGFAGERDAQAAVKRLREAGFADVAPVQSTGGWVVSLGIFGQVGRAREHRDAVRAAGFEAVLRERVSGASRQWLRFAVPASADVATLRGALAGGATLAACAAEGR